MTQDTLVQTLGWAAPRPLRRATFRGLLTAIVLAIVLGGPAAAFLALLNLGFSWIPFGVGAALGLTAFAPTLVEEARARSGLQADALFGLGAALAAFLGTFCLVGAPYYSAEIWGSGDVVKALESSARLGLGAGFERMNLLLTVAIPWSLVSGVAALGSPLNYTKPSTLRVALGILMLIPFVIGFSLGFMHSLGAGLAVGLGCAIAGVLGICTVVVLRWIYDAADTLEGRVWPAPEEPLAEPLATPIPSTEDAA